MRTSTSCPRRETGFFFCCGKYAGGYRGKPSRLLIHALFSHIAFNGRICLCWTLITATKQDARVSNENPLFFHLLHTKQQDQIWEDISLVGWATETYEYMPQLLTFRNTNKTILPTYNFSIWNFCHDFLNSLVTPRSTCDTCQINLAGHFEKTRAKIIFFIKSL